jgi:hypothetical protein
MRERKDRSGKWVLTSRPDSLLRLAGLTGFTSWRAVPPEVVAPKRIPDGLVELTFPDRTDPVPALIELATYPKRELAEQIVDDAALVYLNSGVWPEAVTFVLHPRGTYRLPSETTISSPRGTCSMTFRWRVVEMWTLDGRTLLDSGDVGLVPWVPLTHLGADPVQELRECHERILRDTPPRDVDFMLNVLRVFTRFVYDKRVERDALGGSPMLPEHVLIEMPFIQEMIEEARTETTLKTKRDSILAVIEARFGSSPTDLDVQLAAIRSIDRLQQLTRLAVTCPDPESFRLEVLKPA